MDSKEVTKVNVGFIDHMTKMDEDTKSILMNTIQYALLSITPILGLQCIIETVFPEFEESKGNFELAVEIVGPISIYYGSFIFYTPPYMFYTNI